VENTNDKRENRGRRFGKDRRDFKKDNQFYEKAVKVNRVNKTVKGGRRMSFSALVVVGDGKGRVGYGFGKANDVSEAVKKASERARKSLTKITLKKISAKNVSIPHEVIGHYKSATVLLRPASAGTGVIAGSSARSVCEACGITDILSKSLGSKNAMNIVKATYNGLSNLYDAKEIADNRGKDLKEVWG